MQPSDAAARSGPLLGVHVLDCSESLGAAFCTAMLAGMGAEVTGIEVLAPGDAGEPAFLDACLSRSELYRGYVGRAEPRRRLDLAVPADVAALTELVGVSDVVVEDRREPLLTTAGIAARSSDGGAPAVVVSLTPHGRTGPRRGDLASDLTIFHGAGPGRAVPGLVEDPQTMEPLRLGSHQGHYISGLVAAINVSAALVARRRSGGSVTADVSAHEALANSFRQSLGSFAFYGGGMGRELARGRGAGGMVDGRNLRCKDGYVNIAWAGVQQWDSLKDAMGNPEWAENPDLATPALRYRNWTMVVPKLEEWTAEYEKEHLLYLCQGWRIPCAPVLEGSELLTSPALTSRAFWVSAAGGTLMPSTPGARRASAGTAEGVV